MHEKLSCTTLCYMKVTDQLIVRGKLELCRFELNIFLEYLVFPLYVAVKASDIFEGPYYV